MFRQFVWTKSGVKMIRNMNRDMCGCTFIRSVETKLGILMEHNGY